MSQTRTGAIVRKITNNWFSFGETLFLFKNCSNNVLRLSVKNGPYNSRAALEPYEEERSFYIGSKTAYVTATVMDSEQPVCRDVPVTAGYIIEFYDPPDDNRKT